MSVRPINDDSVIQDALHTSGAIAVVGLSPKEHRDSNKVARYLEARGYEIYGIHPRAENVGDIEVVASLSELKGKKIEVVDVFLNSERLMPVVDGAIELGAKFLWLQFGVINKEAAQKALDAGIEVVMDRCIKVEHGLRM